MNKRHSKNSPDQASSAEEYAGSALKELGHRNSFNPDCAPYLIAFIDLHYNLIILLIL